MRKTKADENSLSLSLQVAITQKNTIKNTVMRIPFAEEYQNNMVSQISGENFAHAQTAETRRSFHLSVNARYEANRHIDRKSPFR